MDTIMDFHHQETQVYINDFVENPSLDHEFIDLISWEDKEAICNFNSEPMINEASFIDNSFLSHPATTATESANNKPRPKSDRSKSLVSERRRRERTKEKLYTLRSLVPNITKMDKASIIGDAVSYMHELHAQANMLKAEIEGLEIETSLLESKNYHGSIENTMKVLLTNNNSSICKKIIQMDLFQVDEKGFYVKIVCNKGEGVAASLYKSLESLTGFNVHNSNLATVSDTFQLTFSLNAKGSEPEINLPNLKLLVTEAFVNQGFESIPLFMLDYFNL